MSMNDYDGNGWWIVLLFIMMLGGGNGMGFGNNGYVLNSDFATLQRQMSDGFNATERRTDSIINGLSNLGYTELGQFNGVGQQISNIGFQLQNNHCQTLQAIDKLGDRVIGYLDCHENQRLRDEVAELKLRASQIAQSNHIIEALS